MHRIHFISGLPRSGSTLLSALLRQNPRFTAGMSGPVAGLLGAMLGEMSGRNEFSVFIDDDQRRRVLEGVVENYYADRDEDVIFDTSRAWCARMNVIAELFPESRVIACVRHMPWVIDSIERLVQKNTFQPSSIFSYTVGGTVYTRADGVAKGDGMVGYAYNALKEAFFGAHAGQLMLVQYETLVSDPGKAMAAIYDFIGEPAFQHDFEHIEFDAEAFDIKAGTPGLHTVRPKVGAVERRTVLPPDVFNRFENDAFWRNPELNLHGVRVV
ncbi:MULTISPECIES: sulfotransferase [Oleiagrimonas]|jgi:sulfotransferase|uniref:Sulfotransferase n=1 Tax=Oleiagrimonas citrea TaxID=1665687 RepID=A0A846ZPU7_9GAMM|nr:MULTISPECIES: sulfotransferase [Oleiagrimonas]NKZ39600.1 sulfotransferase [Oleiagrimonas citrea]RAP59436.1 sulfotransferase [Oleiagrimonas sp. MCCC 1A03011]